MTGAPFVLPETAAVLELLASLEGPHLADLPPSAAREVYHQLGALFDAPVDPGIRTVDFQGPSCPLRAYFPSVAAAGPVIVYLHGGGWLIGDLDTHNSLCALLAEVSGLRVVAVDYRLAPEHPFPAAHDDCLAAARFIASGPAQLEAPVAGIAVAGDSAGGNLAFYLAATLGRQTVLGQLLFYPASDCTSLGQGSYEEFKEGYLLDRRMMDGFIGAYLPDERTRTVQAVSPGLHPLAPQTPPTIIVTAGLDMLRDQGRGLAGQIAAQGSEVHYIEAEGLIHGFTTMRKSLPTGERVIRRATAMLVDMIGQVAKIRWS